MLNIYFFFFNFHFIQAASWMKNVFFHLLMAIDHWMHAIWTQLIKATNAQLLFMKTESQILKTATNFAQSNVKGTSPTIAMESAFLSTNRAMENA
jgi:hypothetical protein